jgi:hypothetical protein
VAKQRSLMPTWVLVQPTGTMDIVGTPWADDLEKENAAIYIKRRMRQSEAVAYSLVTEALGPQLKSML